MADEVGQLEQVLFQPYVSTWSSQRRSRIQDALGGDGRVLETDITELLMAAHGELERLLLEIIWEAVDLRGPLEGVVVMDSRVFADSFPSPSGCKHVPDLCVVRLGESGDPLDLLVVVEAKGNAQVNGGWGYCAKRGSLYTNQAIAYPTGCWTSAPVSDAKMLWIGPDRFIDHEFGPWGAKGLVPGDAERYNLGEAIAEQDLVRASWSGLGWSELSQKLSSHQDGALVAKVIDTWSRAFR